MSSWPENVGILGIEFYFPSQYVDQTELEAYDKVSAGKYTVGLGQAKMGFCSDLEDINSICLTVLSNLMARYELDYAQIGRLEVGTETLVDKSKSVKTVLMDLFNSSGNFNVEGIDTTNACYGGTAALFNAISWIESSYWDGRLAVVVCADIAVYAEGSARPTGGAGAVAMVIGPNAPLVFDRGMRASYIRHAYDFFKPDLTSEYPVVDGKLSIQCYLSALDNCYQSYRQKAQKLSQKETVDLSHFDAMLFHTPYCKLVQKSLARLAYNDYMLAKDKSSYEGTEKFAHITQLDETYFNRDVEVYFMGNSKTQFERLTKPGLYLANLLGNMYTPSLYGCLISLLIRTPFDQLSSMSRIGLFSYGSGLSSSMFSIHINKNAIESLRKIVDKLSYVETKLEQRKPVAPETFTQILAKKRENLHAFPFKPTASPSEYLFDGSYYLDSIDDFHRRHYKKYSAVPVLNGVQ
uniref:Hydroxymethylglutaryl-CoA synthase n=1 Tax=Cacopsylla melanoneura TaxID=428564 RepID=A0A8D8YGF7_9HEMI